MSILHRDPLGEFVSLRDAMNRLMEESFVRPLGEMGERFPVIDMTETDDNVVVKAEMAGVKPEDLDITVEANILTLRGEMQEEREEKEEGKRIYQERRYGAFSRSFTLPTAVKAEEAEADYEDGILTLTLPKAETAKRKSIEIKSK
ncbi:MAG: Hsp20/alpha crystallin family protein [Anaerolineales bacterium]